MIRSDRRNEEICPCLTPAVEPRAGVFPVPVYRRLAGRRVRVLTRDELASRCTAERYRSYSGYRRWVASRA